MKKNILFLILLVFLFNLYCESYRQYININERLKIQKEKEIKKGKYGYLKINFPEFRYISDISGRRLHERWSLSLFVNNEEYFITSFLGSEVYQIPVPTGKIEIEYGLLNQWEGGGLPVFYTTDGRWFLFTYKHKKMIVEIKESETVTFNIVKSSKPDFGLGCYLPFPIPALIQDVSLEPVIEIKKDEESKTEEKIDKKPEFNSEMQ